MHLCPSADGRRRVATTLLTTDGQIAHTSVRLSPEQMRRLQELRLESLGLCPRTVNGLQEAGVFTVGDIVDWSERALGTIRGFGPASLHAIRTGLIRFALEWERSEDLLPKTMHQSRQHGSYRPSTLLGGSFQ